MSILEIENNVKSVLAHEFSRKYGYDNYLKVCQTGGNGQKTEDGRPENVLFLKR